MSLPSYVVCLNKGEPVHKMFCNIGWFDSDELIGETIVEALTNTNNGAEFWKELEFDQFYIYYRLVERDAFDRWLRKEITDNEFIKTFKAVTDEEFNKMFKAG